MSQGESGSNQGIVKCPKCAQGEDPGVIRCVECNTSLRPTLLAVVTLVGPIVLVLLAIASLGQIEQSPVALIAFLMNLAGIVVLLGLRYGRYWAWIGIQVIWVINIAFSVILGLAIHPVLLMKAGVQTLIIILFWMYIRSDRVRAFCSVGRAA